MVPVTKVGPEDEARLEDYPVQADLINKIARDAARGAVGCPVGVQVGPITLTPHHTASHHIYIHINICFFKVVGKHYQEEMVLHVMELIERLVSYNNC